MRCVLGGVWSISVSCGSRGTSFGYVPLTLTANNGARYFEHKLGQEYSNVYRGLFGGSLDNGVSCGSRGSYFLYAPLSLHAHLGARTNLVK